MLINSSYCNQKVYNIGYEHIFMYRININVPLHIRKHTFIFYMPCFHVPEWYIADCSPELPLKYGLEPMLLKIVLLSCT